MKYCKNCDSELCNDQIEAGLYELGRCHDCTTPEEFDNMQNCKDFWECDEVKTLQGLQKISEYGSAPHKFAHEAMVRRAKKMNADIKNLEIY